ncbi:MAG: LPS export ABC transporter periplasmic protein LptC, partial [Gemmatimonadota bacterium]|nr:LPS export ABC transporter periplasmic protein LptC [Gemmatimonadota bacterium]
TMTRGGVREAVLRSDTAYFRESANEADLVGVKLDFFDENGAPSGQLTSRTGHYDLRTGAMTATGSVVLDIDMEGRQRRIETEELHYDLKGDRIWSDKATTSREGATVYRGSSFTSDARFRNVQVQGASTTGGVETGGTGISF